MNKTTKLLIATAALAGLVTGTFTATTAHANDSKSPVNHHEKDACKGKESCKGKDACKGKDTCKSADGKDTCKAKDACKGKEGCHGKSGDKH